MIIAGTGHRPDKLSGWDNPRSFEIPKEVAKENLDSVIGVVSGGAAGWDLALAHAAIDLGIPVMMAVPFEGQEKKWSSFWQDKYNEAREYATKEVILGSPSKKAFLDRNQWMVDYVKGKGGFILALWDGSSGGTFHCVNRAKQAGVPVTNCWEQYKERVAYVTEVEALRARTYQGA